MKLKIKQICFIFLAFVPTTKVLLMPAAVASVSGNDLYFTVLLNSLLDFTVIAAVLYACKKNDSLTFFELIELRLGKVALKIIAALYTLYFMFKMYAPLMEQKTFLEVSLYESTPRSFFFLPFFVISVFSCIKGIKAIGRCAEVMLLFTVPAFIMIFILSLGNADFEALLPVAYNNTAAIFSGLKKSMLWFGQGIYMIFFMGNFKYEKGASVKILLSYAASALVIVFFTMLFYATFADISLRQHYAVLKIARYSLVLSSMGRFDFIAIFLLITSTIYALTLPVLFGTECLIKTVGFKKRLIPSLIINAVLLSAMIFTDRYFNLIMNVIVRYLSVPFALFAYLFPIVISLTMKKKEVKSDKKEKGTKKPSEKLKAPKQTNF